MNAEQKERLKKVTQALLPPKPFEVGDRVTVVKVVQIDGEKRSVDWLPNVKAAIGMCLPITKIHERFGSPVERYYRLTGGPPNLFGGNVIVHVKSGTVIVHEGEIEHE